MKLSLNDIIRFKYPCFPALEGQSGVVTKIETSYTGSLYYTIKVDWIERQKFSEIVLHESGLKRYLIQS
jgi:hypothetical protein